jgi:ABC-type Fe3+/spermidine/putrescine transport system ATPase subunit
MLQVTNIHKRFASEMAVLRGVTFSAAPGEVVCLLGPSGCGKSTLLRIVAGLENADAGSVTFAGQDMRGVPVHERHFGLMFQEYALFPHMTVARNVAFGLRMQGWPDERIRARVGEMLDLVNLQGYGARSVDALSGGEQQRVALARTLAPGPQLVMLDEPLANLDRQLREELVEELRMILKRVGVTTLFVTHDQQEAFALADRLVVLNAGQVAQEGVPEDVYAHPADSFVARFLGCPNLLPLQAAASTAEYWATSIGPVPRGLAPAVSHGEPPGFVLLPTAAALVAEAPSSPAGIAIRGHVIRAAFRGDIWRIHVVPDADPALRLTFDLPAGELSARALPAGGAGMDVVVEVDARRVVAIPE